MNAVHWACCRRWHRQAEATLSKTTADAGLAAGAPVVCRGAGAAGRRCVTLGGRRTAGLGRPVLQPMRLQVRDLLLQLAILVLRSATAAFATSTHDEVTGLAATPNRRWVPPRLGFVRLLHLHTVRGLGRRRAPSHAGNLTNPYLQFHYLPPQAVHRELVASILSLGILTLLLYHGLQTRDQRTWKHGSGRSSPAAGGVVGQHAEPPSA